MIRTYNASDWDACLKLFCEVFNDEPWFDEWTMESASLYLSDIIGTPGFIGIVGLSNHELDGFMLGHTKHWWQGKEYFVHEMCVRRVSQGYGMGTAMMSFAKTELKTAGVETITLLTSKGMPAEHFYLKNGFNELKHLRMYTAKL